MYYFDSSRGDLASASYCANWKTIHECVCPAKKGDTFDHLGLDYGLQTSYNLLEASTSADHLA